MRPSLYLHGLRAARPRQLRARVLRPIRRRRFPVEPAPSFSPPGTPTGLWRSPAFEPMELAGAGTERLRTFHGHYGEDALQLAREGDSTGARAAMLAWIDVHPPEAGDAWHPYTLSTRVGNWIAALAVAPEAGTRRIEESVWRQLLHLERNVEDDILGNHVIRNARALALGGAAYGSARLEEHARWLLQRELPEQVLSDGGHYERSPVYHLVVLRDLLEVEAVLPGSVGEAVLDPMRRFAAALTRPDGNPALFNDGTLDLAPRLELPEPAEGLSLFPETGYAVWRRDGVWLAFDCGPPAPPYLPAHAHADALSFQFWAGGRPVVVDPGMSTYDPGPERDRLRGTRAHSTVSVDGRDQFELWGAFRSGPLPRVELTAADEHGAEAFVEWPDGIRHARHVSVEPGGVRIADTVSGRGSHLLESALPLGGALDGVEGVGLPLVQEAGSVSERLYERVERPRVMLRGEAALPKELEWHVATIAP